MKPPRVDVIVPTVRVESRGVQAILSMNIPHGMHVNFYIIIDNPKSSVLKSVPAFAERDNIKVIRNDGNLGAPVSRNRGLKAGSSDYVLFLDDDVEPFPDLLQGYREAIEKYPDAPGFVGSSKPSVVGRRITTVPKVCTLGIWRRSASDVASSL